jgi:hypothetical protein
VFTSRITDLTFIFHNVGSSSSSVEPDTVDSIHAIDIFFVVTNVSSTRVGVTRCYCCSGVLGSVCVGLIRFVSVLIFFANYLDIFFN